MPHMPIRDLSTLVTTLQLLSAQDTATIKTAEKAIKIFLKSSSSLTLIIQLFSNPIDVAVRHHGALILKKAIKKHFSKLNANEKIQIQQLCMQLLVSDQGSKVISIALAGCVAALAHAVIVKGKQPMPQLFQTLSELPHNPDVRLRLINYSLLAQLAEVMSSELVSHALTLTNMILLGCQDASPEVAVEAMRAATIFIDEISFSEDVLHMKPVLVAILQVLSASMQRGEEDVVLEGLELFQQCSQMEQPLINDSIAQIVPFVVNIMSADEVPYSLRQAASETLNTFLTNRPKLLGKLQLMQPCLEALVSIIAKSTKSAAGSIFSFNFQDNAEDDDDDDDEDMGRLAQVCLNTMAMEVPSKYFINTALEICSQCIDSPAPSMRKAGAAVLGVIVEGCSESIRPLFDKIVPRVTALQSDPDVLVRECACFAIGQFAEYGQPDILHHHQVILPAIFQCMTDTESSIQGIACYVLEMFVENLEPPTLKPFLQPLIEKLLFMLQNPGMISREIIIAALASVAVAAETDFLPFLDGTVRMLEPLLFLSDPKLFETRGRALECLGHIAISIGHDHFLPYFKLGMDSAGQATTLGEDNLKEYSYIFIANTAKAMKSSFVPYLQGLLPHLLDCAKESEVTLGDEDGSEEGEGGDATHEPGAEDEDLEGYQLNVSEGFVNTKKAALTAISGLAEYTGADFAPFIKDSLEAVHEAANSLHEVIRTEAISTLHPLLVAAKAASPLAGVEPVPGVPLDISSLQLVVNVILPIFAASISADTEKKTVAVAFEGIDAVVKELGVAVLSSQQGGKLAIDYLMKFVEDGLKEDLMCQQSVDQTADEDEDDDHDNYVIDAISDLIGTFAKVMGVTFSTYFDRYCCAPLLQYLKPSRPYADRYMVIGIFAEVILAFGPAGGKYADIILPSVQQGLTDPIEGVRRNSAYCVATIVESLNHALREDQILHFLSWLRPLCTRHPTQQATDVGGADIDNALSAVARMISRVPQYIPLDQVLPVMLEALPLRVDPEEGIPVYSTILSLVSSANPVAMQLLVPILHLLGVTLLSESKAISAKTKEVITVALKEFSVSSQLQQRVAEAMAQITDPVIVQRLQHAFTR